ncbi:hypothetical protein [Kutzneria sp. NPDC051319]|uniref:hypothetical protein n=1 Tax=Kutzneria sp. NPDC051319 TaxID=3155047 RepID=UPI00344447E3
MRDPRLGLTETSEERPPCDSCERGGGTIIDGIDKNGLSYKEGEKLRLYVYSNEAGKYEVCSLTLGSAG